MDEKDIDIEEWDGTVSIVLFDEEIFKQELLEILPIFVDCLQKALKKIQGIIEEIGNQSIQHTKWKPVNSGKPIPLLLDKRSKIHRCRNAC